MDQGKNERYVVSAINRDLLKKGIIAALVFIVLLGLFYFNIKPKYFFTYNGKTIELCEGRFSWLDSHSVAGFRPLAIGAEDAKAIAGKKFSSIEDAKKELLELTKSNIQRRRTGIKGLEQKLATQYRALLEEYIIAREMGAKNFDKQIKALSSWLEAFGQPQAKPGK